MHRLTDLEVLSCECLLYEHTQQTASMVTTKRQKKMTRSMSVRGENRSCLILCCLRHGMELMHALNSDSPSETHKSRDAISVMRYLQKAVAQKLFFLSPSLIFKGDCTLTCLDIWIASYVSGNINIWTCRNPRHRRHQTRRKTLFS